jgi:hypothetical protein
VRRTTRVGKIMREFLCSRFLSSLGGGWESRPLCGRYRPTLRTDYRLNPSLESPTPCYGGYRRLSQRLLRHIVLFKEIRECRWEGRTVFTKPLIVLFLQLAQKVFMTACIAWNLIFQLALIVQHGDIELVIYQKDITAVRVKLNRCAVVHLKGISHVIICPRREQLSGTTQLTKPEFT